MRAFIITTLLIGLVSASDYEVEKGQFTEEISGDDDNVDYEYVPVTIDNENITARLDELAENSIGVEIFMQALELAVMEGEETVKIPVEIDPEEHSISLEDALDRSEEFIAEQLTEAQNLMSKIGSKIDEIEMKHKAKENYNEDAGINDSNSNIEVLKIQKDEVTEIFENMTDAQEDLKEFRGSLAVEDMYSYYYDEDLTDEIEDEEDEDSWSSEDSSDSNENGLISEIAEDSKSDEEAVTVTEMMPNTNTSESAIPNYSPDIAELDNYILAKENDEFNSIEALNEEVGNFTASESSDEGIVETSDGISLAAEVGQSESLSVDSNGDAVLSEEVNGTIVLSDNEGDSISLSEDVGLSVDSEGDVEIKANAEGTLSLSDNVDEFDTIPESNSPEFEDNQFGVDSEYDDLNSWIYTTKTTTTENWDEFEDTEDDTYWEATESRDYTGTIAAGIAAPIFFVLVSLCACAARYQRLNNTYRYLTIRASPAPLRKKKNVDRPKSDLSVVTVCEIAPKNNASRVTSKPPPSVLPSYLDVVSGKVQTPPKYTEEKTSTKNNMKA